MRGVFYFYEMSSFIYDVLKSLKSSEEDISQYTFILPSKRAGLFLKQEFAKQISSPKFLPEIIAIESFVEELSQLKQANSIELLFEFFQVYLRLTPKTEIEDFERFSKWAPTILQDFNEIDRYLIEPTKIFNYISAIQELNHWSFDPNPTEMMQGYLKFWQKAHDYYKQLRQHLLAKNIGYQGLMYRKATQYLSTYLKNTPRGKHIFLGFNALNAAESTIIQTLIGADRAKIFWDTQSVFINNRYHDAGLFMRRYIKEWSFYKEHPFNWITQHYKAPKAITVSGASKTVGQVKYVGQLLKQLFSKNKLENTALVLADESLLLPVLNALPDEVESVNVTMGLPLSKVPMASFFEQWFKLHSLPKSSYYHKNVISLLSHPFVRVLIQENLAESLKSQNLTQVSFEQLLTMAPKSAQAINLLFEPCGKCSVKAIDQLLGLILLFRKYLQTQTKKPLLEMEYLHRFSTLFQQLKAYCEAYDFINSISSLHHVFKDLIKRETLDFKGQPLKGLQIMGMLESRVIDFDTVILVSVNEGILPAGKTQNSFIPFDVKIENKLPTYKEKDAIYTYHFYRLMHRASDIHLIYNIDTDALKGGEPSRFIAQLELEGHHKINHQIVVPKVPQQNNSCLHISKTPEIIESLKRFAAKGFSPSSLGQYIRNPIDFYNQRVLGIKLSNELEETVEADTFGSIVHCTLEALYKPHVGQTLTVKTLQSFLSKVDSTVRFYFSELYKKGDISKGKNRISFEISKRYIQNFIEQEIKLLKQGHEIVLIAVEKPIEITLAFEEFDFPMVFKGSIDRIDTFNGVRRIIDYKTSKVEQKDLNLVDWQDIAEDYAKCNKSFQVLSYAYMLQKSRLLNGPSEAGILSFKNLKAGVIKFTKKNKPGRGATKQTIITPDIMGAYEQELKSLLLAIFSSKIPFIEKDV